jgi:phosphatidylglycerol---prolipoprotein diacylglyceryl transferase
VNAAFIPEYALPVVIGIAITLLYPAAPHVRRPENQRGYRALLFVTIVCGVAGAKLVALMGDRLWPMEPLADGWHTVLSSGRSIVGGLLFGHIASELLRPLIGYTAPPNDRIAVALCISVAVGRLGCSMAGCCLGVPYDGALALTTEGVARFPTAPLELVFHLGLAGALFVMERRRVLFGRLFSLYLVIYGVFRFATEPLRATPKPLWDLSVYQGFAILLVLVGALGLWWRSTSPVWRARLAAP